MDIKPLKRPWQRSVTYSKTSIEPWYQTKEWKGIRQSHLQGHTQTEYGLLSNAYCIVCYKESRGINKIPGHTVDHITPIKEGGDKKGPLQTLCKRHNAQKTARDGNRQRKQ